jgi:hypothetical protein
MQATPRGLKFDEMEKVCKSNLLNSYFCTNDHEKTNKTFRSSLTTPNHASTTPQLHPQAFDLMLKLMVMGYREYGASGSQAPQTGHSNMIHHPPPRR